jgi:hypothetical protein
MSGLSGIAAVLAAVGLSAESKDSVPRSALDSAISAALLEGEKAGVIRAGNDAAKITADAIKAANTRALTILGHADAKGREDLAHHLAFESDMSADAAVAMLGKAPKGTDAKTSRMGTPPNPAVASDESQGAADAGTSLLASVDSLVARRK